MVFLTALKCMLGATLLEEESVEASVTRLTEIRKQAAIARDKYQTKMVQDYERSHKIRLYLFFIKILYFVLVGNFLSWQGTKWEMLSSP